MRRPLTNRIQRASQHAIFLVILCLPCNSFGQTSGTPSSGDSVLQKRYEAAQKFQASNDLVHAAEQYRIFLADTLGEIAIGLAKADQYEKAQDNFDEALLLVPDFQVMQLEYARAAFRAGHFDHAELLSTKLLQKVSGEQRSPGCGPCSFRSSLNEDEQKCGRETAV